MIEVFLTNGIDKKTIIDALPQYKGQLKFTVGTKVPAHAVEVTPPSFNAPSKPQAPGAQPLQPLEPGGGIKRNPPGAILEKGPGGIPTGYAQLPQVPPGVGAPSAVSE